MKVLPDEQPHTLTSLYTDKYCNTRMKERQVRVRGSKCATPIVALVLHPSEGCLERFAVVAAAAVVCAAIPPVVASPLIHRLGAH